MTRYVKQHDKHNCGPILIANILKWAGNQYSYRAKKPDLCQKCGTHRTGKLIFGVGQSRVKEVLEYESRNVEKKIKVHGLGSPTLALIDKALKKNDAAAISFYYEHPKYPQHAIGHYFLCVGQTPQFYRTVNLRGEGEGVALISRGKMSRWLRDYPKWNYLWAIQKL